MAQEDVRINRSVTIPGSEIEISFSTSGGPGGQHANKTSTRADLTWNIYASSVLGPRQKERVIGGLRKRIDGAGDLHLSSDKYRSQTRNRVDVTNRFAAILREALVPPKRRIGTDPTRSSKEKRLREKRHRSETKSKRRVRRRDLEGDA